MAPAHSTHPRVQQHQQHQQREQSANSDIVEHGLFLEPMMGTPLAMYIHKDVPDHNRVVDLITVSPSAARKWLLDVFPSSNVSHSVHPEKRRHSRQLLQWRHLYLRYEKIHYTYTILQMIILLPITHGDSEPAYRVWPESISSIYRKEGQGCPRRALGT